jgi:uncharacterized protein YukE
MNMGEIYARITQMRDAAGTISRSAAQINECIEAVEGEMRLLGPDRFMSISAEAFRAEYYRLTPKLKEAFELLTGFYDKLNAAADDIELASRSTQPTDMG